MPPDDVTRLRHILEYGGCALDFVTGRDRADLETDLMLALALTRALQIVGEAAAKVTPEFRQAHPQLPWAQLVGMRNRLVHSYVSVNHDIMWNAVTKEMPALLKEVRRLLPS
jgi:uncharacterized protein with HEPN domain